MERTGGRVSECTRAAGKQFWDVRQDADGVEDDCLRFLEGGKDRTCQMMGCGSRRELSRVTPRSLPWVPVPESGSTAEGQI